MLWCKHSSLYMKNIYMYIFHLSSYRHNNWPLYRDPQRWQHGHSFWGHLLDRLHMFCLNTHLTNSFKPSGVLSITALLGIYESDMMVVYVLFVFFFYLFYLYVNNIVCLEALLSHRSILCPKDPKDIWSRPTLPWAFGLFHFLIEENTIL